jgi:hypothetical protein
MGTRQRDVRLGDRVRAVRDIYARTVHPVPIVPRGCEVSLVSIEGDHVWLRLPSGVILGPIPLDDLELVPALEGA